MKRKQRTESEKQEILAYAKANGVTAAGKQYGVNTSSIYQWSAKKPAKAGKPRAKRKDPFQPDVTDTILSLVANGTVDALTAGVILRAVR